MTLYTCPACGSQKVQVEGPHLVWEFDEEGPVQFAYDDDLESISMEGTSLCLTCGTEGGTWRFAGERRR